jgi:hypothetical protein
VLWLTAGGAVAWRQRDEPPWTPGRGQLRLLQAAASPFWTTAMTGPWPLVVSRDTLVSALDIAMPADAAASTLLHLPFVPAGRYRIHVEPPPRGAGAPPAPSLDLELGRDARPYATWPADAPDRAPAFVLAAPIWSVRVAAHGQERPWTGAVRLQPLLVTPASVPGFAVRATRYADLVVYALDTYSRAEADGLRLTTDRTAHLLVTDLSGEAVSYALTLTSDTAGMTVRVERGAFNRTVHIEDADREVRIAVPAADGAADPVVTVTASDEVQSGRGRDAVVARVSRR